MTEKEFYETIGGNYEEALSRLMRDSLIRKFVLKFPEDPSFAALGKAVETGDWDEAFSASHTLKGVAMNLSFAVLSASAVALTDALRPQNRASLDPEKIRALFASVSRDHAAVCEAITLLAAQ